MTRMGYAGKHAALLAVALVTALALAAGSPLPARADEAVADSPVSEGAVHEPSEEQGEKDPQSEPEGEPEEPVEEEPEPEPEPEPTDMTMLRFYNPYTGEHLYTADADEGEALVGLGWSAEGEAWTAPLSSKTPVYRLYNPYVSGGDHHYTTSKTEYDQLGRLGWRQEGIGWYSDDERGVRLYRLFNPYAQTGSHHYTASYDELVALKRQGWRYEGTAWYGMAQ